VAADVLYPRPRWSSRSGRSRPTRSETPSGPRSRAQGSRRRTRPRTPAHGALPGCARRPVTTTRSRNRIAASLVVHGDDVRPLRRSPHPVGRRTVLPYLRDLDQGRGRTRHAAVVRVPARLGGLFRVVRGSRRFGGLSSATRAYRAGRPARDGRSRDRRPTSGRAPRAAPTRLRRRSTRRRPPARRRPPQSPAPRS
jgi:hypothetical protein